ncbi:Gfo/Idh/MocA family oxidoreductase [Kitasatospora sp. NPDC059571]|uniref:Gfo/Idh/MocA family protein n=1 Tax=Kitasatospora sp. NPDC059571 TaxID=3346871 RepID=UPI0036898EC2
MGADRPGAPRVAVLGTAHPHLADHLRALAGAALVSAVHPGRWPGGPLPDAPVAGDPAAALAGADAAVVCSTTAEHPELLAAALAAGVPVLVEKPLAADPAGALALTRAAEAAGAAVSVAMFLRCAPALRRARALLAGGALGELACADAWFTHPGLPDGLFDTRAAWMLDPAWGAVGAMADLGVHLVDLLRWLRPRAPLRVRSAVLRPLPGGRPGDAGGTALLAWGGVPVALHTGWDVRPGGVALRLAGTRGSVEVRGGELVLTDRHGARRESYRPPDAGDAAAAFLAALAGAARPVLATARDAVACARTMAEIARAAR